jgi:hypothetical protein
MREFQVTSERNAAEALDYFNGFHDGFIKRMVLTSRDEITEDLAQTCGGVFDVEIDFAHYNYRAGEAPFHPYNQMVRGVFQGVREIALDFGRGYLGNSVIALEIRSCALPEPCLALVLTRHYYLEDQRRHELREAQMFTFEQATFSDAVL